MAKDRTKKRTHKRAAPPSENDGIPRSMVIQTSAATAGRSVSQLTKDTRLMMSPDTAARLKERKNNKLRDYTTMAGPLGVTHLLLFNQSTSGPTLRIARTPRGPTLFFRVREYSLARDLNKVIRNPKSPGIEFQHAPLLVLNNFSSSTSKEHPEEELLRTTFQNMFPALNTNTASLSTMKRVVLFHRAKNEPGSDIEVRHYAINTRMLGQDRKVRKIISGENRKRNDKLPNLSRLSDVSEFILGQGGYDSASESEYEEDSKIEVKPTVKKIKIEPSEDSAGAGEQRGVKLVELGPRMTLSLYKVTAEISSGAVLYHRDIKLTPEEIKRQEKQHEQMRALKDSRKAEQIKNVKRKREEAENKSSRSKRGKLRLQEREGNEGTTIKSEADSKDVEDMSEGELEVFLAEADQDDGDQDEDGEDDDDDEEEESDDNEDDD